MAEFLLLFGAICFVTPIVVMIIMCEELSENGLIDFISNLTLEQRLMSNKFMDSGLVLFLAGLVLSLV